MKIIVIGGVAAGMSAAAKAKRLLDDSEIIVYEMTKDVSWGACGLPYFVGDFFSSPNTMIARSIEKFKESGINVKIFHKVEKVDPENQKVFIRNLETDEIFEDNYDKLVIATGARSNHPPIKNIEIGNVFGLKTIDDAINVKKEIMKDSIKDVVVIGGGYVGLEVVEAAYHLGKNVRLIQSNSRVLPRSFDRDITDILADELNSYENLCVNFSELASEFIGDKVITGIKTNKGEYKADLVVISTGIKPNTEFLKDINLDMLQNGAIIINERGETNIKNIYSAGDCATIPHLLMDKPAYIPLATGANKMGRIIGDNLGGIKSEFIGTLGSACIKVMDLEAGRTGLTEREAQDLGLDYKTKLIKEKNQTNYYPGQEDLWIKLIYESKSKLILGGQIVGKKGAVLRVNTIAAAIHGKMTTTQLGYLDFCYAPPFARTWDPLNVAGNIAK